LSKRANVLQSAARRPEPLSGQSSDVIPAESAGPPKFPLGDAIGLLGLRILLSSQSPKIQQKKTQSEVGDGPADRTEGADGNILWTLPPHLPTGGKRLRRLLLPHGAKCAVASIERRGRRVRPPQKLFLIKGFDTLTQLPFLQVDLPADRGSWFRCGHRHRLQEKRQRPFGLAS